jgi:hypothetical protein
MLAQGLLMALAGVVAGVLPPPLAAASAGLLGLALLPWGLRGKPWLPGKGDRAAVADTDPVASRHRAVRGR